MRRPSVSNVVVGLLLLFVGLSLGRSQGPVQTLVIPDTVQIARYAALVKDLTIERDGIRARLEGVSEIAPERIYVVDTIVAPPDTVLRFVTVREGRLSFESLTRDVMSGDMPDVVYRPSLHVGFDVSSCDEGFSIGAGGEVLCDPARFGHLYVGPVLTRDPFLAAWWRPSYQSPWEIAVGRSQTSWVFSLRRGIKIW